MSFTSIVAFAGGIGLFLLGMRLMTTGLQSAAGPGLRLLLARGTTTQPRAVGAGIAITALVQSSSAVTFATIGFVNAGLISLSGAIAVIYGANLGTTVTSWLVALVGFKLDLQALALPFIAIGMALRVSAGTARRGFVGEALAGFGVFFLGIDVLKDAFGGLGPLVAAPADAGHPLFLFVSIGLLMTLVMQSSSAALVVTLSAAGTGVLPLQAAAAVVVGANVGTTTTALFAVIGATAAARRAAMAHVVFNVITAVLVLATLPVLLWVIARVGESMLGHPLAPPTALAAFHTLGKLLGILVMWPMTAPLTRWLERRFRSRETDAFRPQYLDSNIAATPSLALEAVAAELDHALSLVRHTAVRSLASSVGAAGRADIVTDCAALDRLFGEIGEFAADIDDPRRAEEVARSLRTVQYLDDVCERVLEYGRYGQALGSIAATDVATGLAELAAQASAALDMGTDAAAQVFEAGYQECKSLLLRSGAARKVPVQQMAVALDRISALRRLVDQYTKARRSLEALQAHLADSVATV